MSGLSSIFVVNYVWSINIITVVYFVQLIRWVPTTLSFQATENVKVCCVFVQVFVRIVEISWENSMKHSYKLTSIIFLETGS